MVILVMRNIIFAFIVIILLSPCALYADTKVPIEVLRLTELPEGKLDIGIAALVLAKEVYPDIDIEEYSKKIDTMAKLASVLTMGSKDPDYRVRVLNTFLYQSWGIEYDMSDIYAKKPENRYLNGMLDTKKGSCITMPLLYLAIAQRMGYPVYPVAVPNHLIVRYADPSLKLQNIEATSEGGFVPDDEYQYVLQIPDRGIQSGAYLRTMSNKEFLGDLIAQNAIYWGQKGDVKRAMAYVKLAVKLNPRSADNHHYLGQIYKSYNKKYWYMADGTAAFYMAKAAFIEANKRGLTVLRDGNYVEQQQKAQAEHRRKNP